MPDSKLRTKNLSKSGRPLSNARIGTIAAVIADRMTTEATKGDETSMILTRGASDEHGSEVNIE